MLLSELAEIVMGHRYGPDVAFDGFSTDSRSVQPGNLFVALVGERFDGHDFVATVQGLGAVAVMVEHPLAEIDIPQIVVGNTRLALGAFGAWRRISYEPKVIGVTGSNGKTSVKEMIAAVLASVAPTHKTQGNLNNDLGVPLTLLQLQPEHAFAVIEMGANHKGEIAYCSGLAWPDVAVITNAGAAHLEGFGSRDGVAEAKAEILGSLSEAGTAVLNADDEYLSLWRQRALSHRVITFGFSADADVRADSQSLRVTFTGHAFHSVFDYWLDGEKRTISLALAGRHNAMNALATVAACRALGISQDCIEAGLAQIQPVRGRMQPLAAFNGALLIDDTYNANPSSLAAAVDVLVSLPGEERWVALGTFEELGEQSAALHADLGQLLKRKGVNRLIASGRYCEHAVSAFGEGAVYCQNQEDSIALLKHSLTHAGVLLVKGSRSQKMERVIQALSNETGRKSACC